MYTALFFISQNCLACKKMYPVIEQLQKEGCQITIIDSNQKYATSRKYNITVFPTTVILQNNKEIKRHEGIVTLETLRKSLKQLDYKLW